MKTNEAIEWFKGKPIMGSSRYGYSIPRTKEEGLQCIEDEIYDRARSIMALKQVMEDGVRQRFNKPKQMSFAEVR